MRVVLALVLLAATTVRGEDNCGRMQRYATQISGHIRLVSKGKVVVTVWSLPEDNLALQKDATVSVPLKKGQSLAEGKLASLQIVWLACDGKLRRLEEIAYTLDRPIEEYDGGWLEVGHVYRATAVGRSLDPPETLPRHQVGGLSWTNADDFLPDDGQRRTVVFEVTSQDIEYQGDHSWIHILQGTIREARAVSESVESAPPK